LKKAAIITAELGESTRVETTVAIALALSWKPLIKSKMNAQAIIKSKAKKLKSTSRMFKYNVS